MVTKYKDNILILIYYYFLLIAVIALWFDVKQGYECDRNLTINDQFMKLEGQQRKIRH